jgi:hypothetical protein
MRSLFIVAVVVAVFCGRSDIQAGPFADDDHSRGNADFVLVCGEWSDGPIRDTPPYESRSTCVQIDERVLLEASPLQRVSLNLFGDVNYTGLIEDVGRTRRGAHVCRGTLDGHPGSSFSLFTTTDGVVGSIRSGEQVFRIRPMDDDLHLIQQIKPISPLRCGVDGSNAVGGLAERAGDEIACDNDHFIDVMVVYTPLAKADAGGASSIEAEIELALLAANEAFDRSLINPRLNLVHLAEISYNEDGGLYLNHLQRLTDPQDGFLDSVHELRNQYAADVVSLMVADDDEFCGLAWAMTELTASFESNAFNVVTWWCAADYFALAHEIGHNLGCNHDHDNARGKVLFPYSYGHRFNISPTQVRRTVMAYEPGTMIQNFSNPNVLFANVPTGVSGEGDDAADNARTVNETASTVANFRCGGTHCAKPVGKLLAFDAAQSDQFGIAVAMHENTVVIGASGDDDGPVSSKGSAYVFELLSDGHLFQFKQKLTPAGAIAGTLAGRSVAIWGDVIVLGTQTFGAYVFRFDGSQWVQEQQFDFPEGITQFGFSVAVENDVILVGAPFDGFGAVYVYRFDGLQWSLEQKLVASDGAPFHEFGRSLAIWNDVVLIGSRHELTKGAAYVFRHIGEHWVEEQKLVASDGTSFDNFAWSLSIWENLAVIGTPEEDNLGSNSGAAYSYRHDGSTWTQQQKLLASNGSASDGFGRACAVHGNHLIVGAPGYDGTADNTGAIYVFKLIGDQWVEQQQYVPIDGGPGESLGTTLSFAKDVCVVGCPSDDVVATNCGSASIMVGFVDNDCNGNGIPDTCDVIDVTSIDRNGNFFPDECEPVPGDTNGDLVVNVDDLLAVVNAWGACLNRGMECPADLNGNGTVDVDDLLLVIANWT